MSTCAMVGETGSELLARLQTNNIHLTLLEPHIFPGGPQPGQLIEFTGKPGCGKSQYVTHVIANVISPVEYDGLQFGGVGASVVLVDTDHLFSLLRLVSVLEHRIISAISSSNERVTNVQLMKESNEKDGLNVEIVSIQWSEEQIEACIKSCLARLYVVRCASSSQLLMTLHSLESLLSYKRDIRLLIIDSISAFTPIDKEHKWNSAQTLVDHNVRLISDVLKKILTSLRLVVIVTDTSYEIKVIRNKRPAESVLECRKKCNNRNETGEGSGLTSEEGNCKGDDVFNVTSIRNETSFSSSWEMPDAQRFLFSKYFSKAGSNLKGDDGVGVEEVDLFSISSLAQQYEVKKQFKIVAGGIKFIEN